jgi:N-acetylmuramoyl-L-alanine amidase
MAALAYGDQVPGDEAVIANTGGYGASLRETAGDDAVVLTTISDDTSITILEGPVTADNGSLWYLVSADGLNGYIDATFIAYATTPDETTSEDAPADEEVVDDTESVDESVDGIDDSVAGDGELDGTDDSGASEGVEEPSMEVDIPVIPWQEPVDYGVVVNNIQDGTFAPEGLACRPATNEDVPATYRYQLGETVELTGPEFWEGDFSWYPVNCAGVGGFVKSLYVAVDSQEEPTGDDTTTDEVPVADESTDFSAPVDEPTPTAEVTEDVSTEQGVPEGDDGTVDDGTGTDETDAPAEDVATEAPTEEVVATVDDGEFSAPVDETADAVDTTDSTPATEDNATTDQPDSDVSVEVGSNGQEQAVDPSLVIGSAEVTGTNGDGVRCRVGPSSDAAVISVLSETTVVQVLARPDNGWMQIVCGNQAGYANTEFLWSGGAGEDELSATDNDAAFSAAANGTATVTGTNGQGLNCRSSASISSSVIAVLSPGSTVTTRGAASGGWVPVVCGGQNGYASTDYLTSGATTTPGGTTNTGGETTTAGNGTVTGTNGDGVRCRTGAGTSSSIITVLPEGATVATRGASSGGWTPVTCGGMNGYVSSQYLTVGGGGTTAPPADNSGGQTTGNATVTGTNGDGVRCRTGAGTSSSIITVLPEGTSVATRGSASSGWQPVVCGGQNGYVSSQYLTLGGNSGSAPDPTPVPGDSDSSGKFAAEDHAKVTSALNLRYSPSMTGGIAAVAPTGTVVRIVGGGENGYYKVDWDGLGGYMHGDYLVKTSEGLSERGGSAAPAPVPGDGDSGNSGGGTSTGNAIVDFAMGYLGYPYVWATHGPASFDCSGFTYWVAKNVVGVDIGTGLWTQTAAGTPVGRDSLQPGDIVFFQNTYKAGLSHSGIYIGGNQFIHAENENTGVKISDLNSTYYSSRWYGAVRLG